jgi:hypothetical protein
MPGLTLHFASAFVAGLLMDGLGIAQVQPAPDGTWVPFTARYTETLTSRDSAGHQTNRQVATIVETRSKDGSLLSVKSENGQVTSGNLWDSCGQRCLIRCLRFRRQALRRWREFRVLFVPSGEPSPARYASIKWTISRCGRSGT